MCGVFQVLLTEIVKQKSFDALIQFLRGLTNNLLRRSPPSLCIGINSFNANTVLEKLKKEFPSSKPTIENGTEIYLRDPDNIRVQLSGKDYKG